MQQVADDIRGIQKVHLCLCFDVRVLLVRVLSGILQHPAILRARDLTALAHDCPCEHQVSHRPFTVSSIVVNLGSIRKTSIHVTRILLRAVGAVGVKRETEILYLPLLSQELQCICSRRRLSKLI